MDRIVIYIHGQGGSPDEAQHYIPLFESCDVVGIDYTAQTPWEAKEELPALFDSVCRGYKSVVLIANSIGAFFAMNALADENIEKAFFISPVVDMEKLITDMMQWAGVSEEELRAKGVIETAFGQVLDWQYLCYVRQNPIKWVVSTHIAYGEKDNLTDYATISRFAQSTGATLDVMPDGEHWFHTPQQMEFIDRWIEKYK